MRRLTDIAGGGGGSAAAGACGTADINELSFDAGDDVGLAAPGFAARKELSDELDFTVVAAAPPPRNAPREEDDELPTSSLLIALDHALDFPPLLWPLKLVRCAAVARQHRD